MPREFQPPVAPETANTRSSVFDFIICGAGSAGSVVAARLAENPEVSVLLIEAGGGDDVPEVMTPAAWPANLGSARDWNFVAQANPHLNGRAISLNMGKVLGGGSSINVMVWARGHKNDWEHFAEEAGDPAWGYEAVLNLYRRIENWQGRADARRRGSDGPVFVQSAINPQPVARAMVQAAEAMGLPSFDSPNGEMMEGRGGVAINDLIVRDGRRVSIFQSYVQPKRGQSNLTILTDTLVSRLVIKGSSVTGVEVIQAGQRRQYAARHEVILSLGAINTPKVLMQSGIGPDAELRRHGIATVQNLPGVGQNHQDHVSFGCIFESKYPQAVGYGGSEATLYWSSDARLPLPDMFHCQVEFPAPSPETAAMGNVPTQGWTMFAGLAHPKSRGSVHLSGPNPDDPVLINANTLSHPDDLKAAVANIDLCRSIGGHGAFDGLSREALPGKLDARAMEDYARNAAVTYWHQCGTAKMGRDAMAVVDGRLKVHGVERLRVADASIMPIITSGNTMAPCVVIGERAADMIKAAYEI